MPASRTSSIPPRSQPFPTLSPQGKRHHTATNHDLDTISLTSSDAENTDPSNRKSHHDKTPSRTRPKKSTFVPRPEDIIEISSDEEDDSPPQAPVPPPSVIADYRRQISRIREESVKHRRDFERVSKELKALREENQKLKAVQKPNNDTVVMEMSQLSDHLDCEICTCRMWTPYILPDCGHSFCQLCLHDWFTATRLQFFNTHPQVPHVNYAFFEILRQLEQNPHIINLPFMQTLMLDKMPPRPNYTCPTCRAPVSSRPTEAFAQKALVHTIATAAGEVIPKAAQPSSKKGKGVGAIPSPWDAFFTPRKT